jgi:PAS domain S-box-containing protein
MTTLKQSSATNGPGCPDPELVARTKMLDDWPVPPASILDQVSPSVIATDLQGNITAVNRATQQMYGYTSQELTGKNVATLHSEDGPNFLPQAVVSAVVARGQFQEQVRDRAKSGKTLDLLVSFAVLRN